MTVNMIKAAIDVEMRRCKDYDHSKKETLEWVLDLICTSEKYEAEERKNKPMSLIQFMKQREDWE